MAKKDQTKVEINDSYYVIIDQYNYTVMKHTKSEKSNKMIDVVIGYFPNMQHALKAIRRNELTNITTDMTLDDYLAKLKDLEQTIR